MTDQQKTKLATKASNHLMPVTRRWFEAVVEDWDLAPATRNGFGAVMRGSWSSGFVGLGLVAVRRWQRCRPDETAPDATPKLNLPRFDRRKGNVPALARVRIWLAGREKRWRIFFLLDGPLALAALADHLDAHDTKAAGDGAHSPCESRPRLAVRALPVERLIHVGYLEREIYHG